MDVSQALRARRSVRAFTPQVPSAALVQQLMEDAALAASGGNLQPWRVVALTGEPLRQVLAAVATAPAEDAPTNQSYPPNLWEPYRSRRFKNGEDLYKSIAIPRENKAARLEQLAKNGQFFFDVLQIIGQYRGTIGIDHRRGGPFVFPDSRGDF